MNTDFNKSLTLVSALAMFVDSKSDRKRLSLKDEKQLVAAKEMLIDAEKALEALVKGIEV